jgi:hypothetical protein
MFDFLGAFSEQGPVELAFMEGGKLEEGLAGGVVIMVITGEFVVYEAGTVRELGGVGVAYCSYCP